MVPLGDKSIGSDDRVGRALRGRGFHRPEVSCAKIPVASPPQGLPEAWGHPGAARTAMVNGQNEQSRKFHFLPNTLSFHALLLIFPRFGQSCGRRAVRCCPERALSNREWATKNPARPREVLAPALQVPALGQTRGAWPQPPSHLPGCSLEAEAEAAAVWALTSLCP